MKSGIKLIVINTIPANYYLYKWRKNGTEN